MKTWVLVARSEVDWAVELAQPPSSELFTCPLCALPVRAYAHVLSKPEPRTVFQCPGCGALVEGAAMSEETIEPLPGATLDELKTAIQDATREAERWRAQADIARQRKDLEWAEQTVSWVVAAERRADSLRRQAAKTDPSTPWPLPHRQ